MAAGQLQPRRSLNSPPSPVRSPDGVSSFAEPHLCGGGGVGTPRSSTVTANVTKPAAHRGPSSLSTAAIWCKGLPWGGLKGAPEPTAHTLTWGPAPNATDERAKLCSPVFENPPLWPKLIFISRGAGEVYPGDLSLPGRVDQSSDRYDKQQRAKGQGRLRAALKPAPQPQIEPPMYGGASDLLKPAVLLLGAVSFSIFLPFEPFSLDMT